jgi:hypothetical protein
MTAGARILILLLLAGVVAVSSALAGGDPKRFTVSSTLDGKRVLPLRIHWIAHPHIALAQVKEVDYFIDGQRAWTEHHPPYYYGSNEGSYGNWLVTSFLKPGLHTFTVRAVTLTNKKATDTVRARVIAAPAAARALGRRLDAHRHRGRPEEGAARTTCGSVDDHDQLRRLGNRTRRQLRRSLPG